MNERFITHFENNEATRSQSVMKGITISERYKEKDAYDIYSVLAHLSYQAQLCC